MHLVNNCVDRTLLKIFYLLHK